MLERGTSVTGCGMWDSILGSAEGAIPGTIVEGENAACSMSAK